MDRPRSPLPRAKQALAVYYREHGIMPSVQKLADLLGLASTSSAHYLVQKLRAEGHLTANEHGKLAPGPLFDKAPGRPEVPIELLRALPDSERLQVLRVDETWKMDEGDFQPGDLLVVAPIETCEQGDLLVLRRGSARIISSGPRPGWRTEGVLLGQYRAFKTSAQATQ
jgi:SOS-response transcriptional repressor LexA